MYPLLLSIYVKNFHMPGSYDHAILVIFILPWAVSEARFYTCITIQHTLTLWNNHTVTLPVNFTLRTD